jgi:hypothetical protein
MSTFEADIFAGLKALAESAFPKHCRNCGRVFQTAEQFLFETERVDRVRSGLKQSWDDNDATIVEVYRNCLCGSTLMDFFSDRRDYSEAGLRRRERFGQLIDQLVAHGVEKDVARAELLKILRGQKSELIDRLRASLPGRSESR